MEPEHFSRKGAKTQSTVAFLNGFPGGFARLREISVTNFEKFCGMLDAQ
ncbi:MAG TPA: hypothetical protein VHS05_23440 [Pyrinomonadaceae bacterium]|nr:hypothetical protein [Pyrinomonadaceae bacterium]